MPLTIVFTNKLTSSDIISANYGFTKRNQGQRNKQKQKQQQRQRGNTWFARVRKNFLGGGSTRIRSAKVKKVGRQAPQPRKFFGIEEGH
jgi:hypothetical protein